MYTRIYLTVYILCIISITVLAQDDTCPSLVESALQNVSDLCAEIGRNQVCYGNIQLDVNLVEESEIMFDAPGDLADVIEIESLSLSTLQPPDEWGIALMKIQANLPDTVPGQNVTMLLFGDVFIENQSDVTDNNELYGPMQAVVFRSGVGELDCEEAPPDGILIQTPSGAGTVTLNMNHVLIELGSTAFLNAVPNGLMQITLLEGEALVTAEGVTVTVPAGLRAEIPLDAEGLASGSPEVVVYETEEIATLPIGNLEIPIELPEPLQSTALSIDDGEGDFIQLMPGEWCSDSGCADLSILFPAHDETGITFAEPFGFIPRVGENTYYANIEVSKQPDSVTGIFYDVTVEILSPTEFRFTYVNEAGESNIAIWSLNNN